MFVSFDTTVRYTRRGRHFALFVHNFGLYSAHTALLNAMTRRLTLTNTERDGYAGLLVMAEEKVRPGVKRYDNNYNFIVTSLYLGHCVAPLSRLTLPST